MLLARSQGCTHSTPRARGELPCSLSYLQNYTTCATMAVSRIWTGRVTKSQCRASSTSQSRSLWLSLPNFLSILLLSLWCVRGTGKTPTCNSKHYRCVNALASMMTIAEGAIRAFQHAAYALTLSRRNLTCRRKEMQMLRHTKGFAWGPSAVCTATWGGVRVCDILNACGTRASAHGCYVHFG